ncbi:MAG: hypothetical protein ABSG13_19850, partial [Bryobacteraceae bacterium]
MRCLLVLVTALALSAAGETSLTVAKLTEFIRSAVQLKSPDKQVAETLRHFKMAEKLDDRTIEELQSLGAGPKTVAALKELGDASASLPEAAPPPPKPVVVPPPPPDSIEQAKVIDEAREYVVNYTKSLPNFICVQVTRRDLDRGGTGSSWYHLDTITSRLSYSDHHEDYEVIMKNDQPVTNVKMEQLGGTVSAGEFGTMMSEIFDPESHADFSWDHWATLRGRRNYVFAYDIAQENSRYHMKETETGKEIVPAYRGLIYIDRDTKMVTKITLNPYNIASDFPVREAHESLDYDFQTIGDAQYMLPLKA